MRPPRLTIGAALPIRAGVAALLLATAVLAGRGGAETFGGITPGETRRREVEAQYGRPSRERTVVEEGKTVPEWTYVGDRVPAGLERMVVSFGLIRRDAFAPDLVRSVTIYPKPRVFTATAIANGWGTPDAVGTDEQTRRPALRYDARGLLVVMDPTGSWAEMMLFAPKPSPPKP